MTAWPEGRMEFVCTIPAEKGEERWLGEVVVKRHSTCMAELLIYGRDSCINAVIGKYMNGQYICIPDIDSKRLVILRMDKNKAAPCNRM